MRATLRARARAPLRRRNCPAYLRATRGRQRGGAPNRCALRDDGAAESVVAVLVIISQPADYLEPRTFFAIKLRRFFIRFSYLCLFIILARFRLVESKRAPSPSAAAAKLLGGNTARGRDTNEADAERVQRTAGVTRRRRGKAGWRGAGAEWGRAKSEHKGRPIARAVTVNALNLPLPTPTARAPRKKIEPKIDAI